MIQKHLAKLLGALVAVVAVVAVLAPMAMAKPKPPYEQFAGCPNEPGKITSCIHSVVTGGHFKIGSKEVPIEHKIGLTGGTGENLGTVFANSEGGMEVVKQKVPGGIIGLTGLTWLAEFLGSEALTLYAAAELVNFPNIDESFEHISLPIRVHLINGALGNNCYIGSPTSPISLNLTNGTTSPPPPNKPISGTEPELTFNFETKILGATGGVYVDNSFSAPGVSGCVLTLFGFIPISINGVVDSASGLPAKAGTNEAVQDINTEIVAAKKVYP